MLRGLQVFLALQLVMLGIISGFPAAVKATLGVAGVVLGLIALRPFTCAKH